MVVEGRRGAGGATGGAGSARGDDGDVEAALGRRDRGVAPIQIGEGREGGVGENGGDMGVGVRVSGG